MNVELEVFTQAIPPMFCCNICLYLQETGREDVFCLAFVALALLSSVSFMPNIVSFISMRRKIENIDGNIGGVSKLKVTAVRVQSS